MTTPNVPEMTCKELVELVTDYLEEALSSVNKQRFDEHLRGCPFCRTYLDQMQHTIRTLGCLPEEAIPPEGLDALLAHFRRWR